MDFIASKICGGNHPREHFTFAIHWIPSHIENTSFGRKPIQGNIRADMLAKAAQQNSSPLDTANRLDRIRDQILAGSASLVSKIDYL